MRRAGTGGAPCVPTPKCSFSSYEETKETVPYLVVEETSPDFAKEGDAHNCHRNGGVYFERARHIVCVHLIPRTHLCVALLKNLSLNPHYEVDGELVQTEEIEVGAATMVHDFNITENYVIFMDLPLMFDIAKAGEGGIPLAWSDDYGARLGVMPRNGTNADVTWYDIDPC